MFPRVLGAKGEAAICLARPASQRQEIVLGAGQPQAPQASKSAAQRGEARVFRAISLVWRQQREMSRLSRLDCLPLSLPSQKTISDFGYSG
jgi:hypothetical protein